MVLSAGRTRHPFKKLELLVREAGDKGWRVERRARGDFKMKCPCRAQHMKTVEINPSSPLYEQELRRYLARSTCWTADQTLARELPRPPSAHRGILDLGSR
jgi:hypothetical protein